MDGGSFLLIVPSGLAMFVGYASDLIASQVFALKMCLILARRRSTRPCSMPVAFRSAAQLGCGSRRRRAAARAAGAVSLALWVERGRPAGCCS